MPLAISAKRKCAWPKFRAQAQQKQHFARLISGTINSACMSDQPSHLTVRWPLPLHASSIRELATSIASAITISRPSSQTLFTRPRLKSNNGNCTISFVRKSNHKIRQPCGHRHSMALAASTIRRFDDHRHHIQNRGHNLGTMTNESSILLVQANTNVLAGKPRYTRTCNCPSSQQIYHCTYCLQSQRLSLGQIAPGRSNTRTHKTG